MSYAFLAAIVASLGLGVLLGMLVVANKPRRRRDRYARGVADEIYGDVPFLGAEPEHFTGHRNQFNR